ncbi:MAG: hypothetical protein H6Q21_1215 [Bacteroidetes bacterium]|nr:hypothetical protein [Bacteroidota bacterium]
MPTTRILRKTGFLLLFMVVIPGLAWTQLRPQPQSQPQPKPQPQPQSQPQPIEITSSEFNFNLGSTVIHRIFGHDAENFFVLKFYGGQYHLEKLDSNLNFIREEPLKLYEGMKTYDLETIVHFHGELYLFATHRKFAETDLIFQKIDKETLLPATEFTLLATVKFIRGNWADFHFALSRHETRLMIAAQIKLSWEKVLHNEFYVFDKGMELLWGKKDYYSFTGQGPRESKFVVDEQGNVSVLSLTKRESIMSVFQDVKNSYVIHRYTKEGETFHEYPLTLENRYIRGIKIMGGEQGELICAGLYSELARAGVGGTFFFKIDPENGIIYDNQSEAFGTDMLSVLMDLKEPIMAKEELMKYELTDLVLRKNGHSMLIAEQLFEQNYNTYNNLIVTCFDTTGQVYWTQVVPKRQDFDIRYLLQNEEEAGNYRDLIKETGMISEYLENYCSYALVAPVNENDITLIYNDDIRNLNPDQKPRSFNNPKKSYLAVVHISESGALAKYSLQPWKRKALYPEPIRYYDTLGETIIIPAFKGRKFNYYKITTKY